MRLEGTDTPLPRFWKEGMRALEELHPSLRTKRSISKEAALVEPLWYSHLFEVPEGLRTHKHVWESKLRLRTIGDMVSEDGTPWSEEQVREQILEDIGPRYRKERGGGEFYAPLNGERRIGIHTLVNQYKEIQKQVPDYLLRAAGSSKVEIEGPLNIADTLLTKRTRRPIAQWLEREGWKRDQPLREGGEPYPIWPKARLFETAPPNSEDEEEEGEGGVKFVKGPTLEEEMREEPGEEKRRVDRNFYAIEGREGEGACARVIGDGSNEGGKKVALYEISPRGLPIEMVKNDSPTGDPEGQKSVTEEVDSSDLRRLIKWRDGLIGRADQEYPHPDQWTIDHCPGRKPLDKIGVREITTALRKPRLEQPSCIKNWEVRLEECGAQHI